jgi:hypothetical protein
VAVADAFAELQVDQADPHSAPLPQRADGDVPASGELSLIEGARLVGDGLRCVALLHGVFLDRLRWQRARHTLLIGRLESRWKSGWKIDFLFSSRYALESKEFFTLQHVSIACFALWPDVRIGISEDTLQGPPMPFVNERIPAEDFETYQLREIDKHHVVGGVNARTWTVDRERGMYLRLVANGREEFSHEMEWTFY